MAGKAFIDTNVLLRANNDTLPLHRQADHLIKTVRHDGYELWISRQIIREYLAQITRPGFLATPLTIEQTESHINVMRAVFKIADETEQVTTQLLALLKAYPTGGKQVHDANIVATLQAYNLTHLFTLNPVDFVRFANLITVVTLEELLRPPLPG